MPRPRPPRHVADLPCPCGGGSYAACCFLPHDGKPAANPETLMRSRFSAYAQDRRAYLLHSWHPDTRPADVTPEPGLRWVRLEILGTTGGGLFDAEGTVAFRAHYTEDGRPGVMEENSRFVHHDGRWVYWGPVPSL
ncbi:MULTISPECIES: YchJ family metal-binding protein [Actinoplanes]|uniref:YchJ family protein n=1 Tax=Actinoplanes TaxID=1865 RepID=UPI0005F2BF6A|nr:MULTISPECIES: YchJ family metal-binding protein [Actinoplanes]GLY05646.1 UPF0225 protein [Actinoplanes sp. NBRC 101535]